MLDVESDITAAGDGGIMITNTNSLPPVALPRVASASCEASKGRAQLSARAAVSPKVSKGWPAADSMLAAGAGYDHLLTKRRAGHADRGKLSLR